MSFVIVPFGFDDHCYLIGFYASVLLCIHLIRHYEVIFGIKSISHSFQYLFVIGRKSYQDLLGLKGA